MSDKHELLVSISQNTGVEAFVKEEGARIQDEDPLLAELLALSFEQGPEILGIFNATHYALGATLAHMLIRESRRYQEHSTPRATKENFYYYSQQMLTILSESNTPGFVGWLKQQAHLLVPDLVEFFEGTIKEDLPPEMYMGMVDVAYPFALEAKITT